MPRFTRRSALIGAASSLILPRIAIGQSDNRPSITIAVQKVSNSNTLDNLREQSNVGERVFFTSLWEPLISKDWLGTLLPRPGLATEWRRIDDQTIELKLRQGVKFHNGAEMTAEDVVFSFSRERMFGNTEAKNRSTIKAFEHIPMPRPGKELPAEVIAVSRRAWPDLARVEAVDKYTVRFYNATPDVTLEGRLARYGSDILSRKGWEDAASYLDWARKPVTTGPYKVVEFKPDNMLVLEAHDEYWGGRPPVKRIRFVEVPEVPSRIAGLISGQYQFACDIPPDQIADIEKNAAFEVLGGTILNHRLSVFDKNHAQLRNPLVRRAFTHAIDRQTIVDALWAGRTRVPNGLQWEYYGDMFHADWKVPEYNPTLAKDLLRQAGYKGDPIPYRLLNNYYTNQNATAQVLVEMWRSVGLNVEINSKENWTQIMERSDTRGVRDWSNSAPFSDPVSSIVNQHGPNGQQQQIGEWTNAEMNTLCEVLETSTDHAKRKLAFRRMLEICERDDPAYTVLHQNATFTAKAKATKWKVSPAFAMTSARAILMSDAHTPFLEISGLTVGFDGVNVLHDVDLSVARGEALGLVGESGSGKSVTWLAALGLLPGKANVSGSAQLEGLELVGAAPKTLDVVRGGRIAMIFQDPASALNPVLRIGRQIGEALALHRGLSGASIPAESRRLLELVGIPDAERRLGAYPHEFSGGQNQRVMIAMALAGAPDLLVADEPTTALDVTIQAQILDLINQVRREMNMALVLISHDLGVIAETCDRVAVMYAGRIVEQASAAALFENPGIPTHKGCCLPLPPLDGPRRRLQSIPGVVPDPKALPPGCAFGPRCDFRTEACEIRVPPLVHIQAERQVACLRHADLIQSASDAQREAA